MGPVTILAVWAIFCVPKLKKDTTPATFSFQKQNGPAKTVLATSGPRICVLPSSYQKPCGKFTWVSQLQDPTPHAQGPPQDLSSRQIFKLDSREFLKCTKITSHVLRSSSCVINFIMGNSRIFHLSGITS